MDKYFKVPTDGCLNQFALTPSELIISCWMMNLINLNFTRMSYSFVRNGIENQCGIKYDIRTIKTIIASIIRKGVLTRTKVQNSYAYQNSDLNVPNNIQSDHYQTDHPQTGHHQNDHHNDDQNVPINSDLNVPNNIQSDHPINISNKEERKEEERNPNQSFSYSTQYQQESREVRTNKFYKDAYQRFPRELIRAQEVSQCIDEMCLCYELNAREFERSKPNFKAEVRNRAKIIVQALLNDTAKFAPIELFWGIKCYETQNTAEPTPASVKKACIRSRIENKELTDTLQYTLKLIRNEQAIPDDEQFILRFTKKYSSEIEGLLNAYYSESKDYDVKFNELVLKMAELPERDNLPNYWDMYQNEFKALPINLDIRLLA